MKYFKRIFIEAREELEKYGFKSLPFIEALVVMIIVSRGMAESIEIFPYSISTYLIEIAHNWIFYTAPYIDRVYSTLGYPFAPDVAVKSVYLSNSHIYPICVLMISLWIFSIIYTFTYWVTLTSITYGINKMLGGNGSLFNLLVWIGLAHIPLINWWFYNGCEMLYELKEQEIYMNIFPPYEYSAKNISLSTPWGRLPSYLPVEGFWVGYGFGVFSLLLSILLITAFVYFETGLKFRYTLIASIPWILYLILLLVGSMNIDAVNNVLYQYVKEGMAWSWFGR